MENAASETARARQSEVQALAFRFSRDLLVYAPATAVPALLSLASVVIFTRLFPPAEYGAYSLAMAISIPLLTLASQWAAQPVGRYYAEYREQNNLEAYRGLVSTLALLVFGTIGALAAVGALASWLIWGGAIQPLVYGGAFAAVAVQGVTAVVLPILPAALLGGAYRNALVSTSVLSLTIALMLNWWLGKDIAWLLFAQALAGLLVLPYIALKARISLWRPVWRWTVDAKRSLARFWQYGLPLAVWMFAAGLLNVGDRYVIQAFRGLEDVGIYGVNYNLVVLAVQMLNGPVLMAAFPILTRQWAAGQRVAARSTLGAMTDLYVVLALGLVGVITVSGPSLASIVLGGGFSAGSAIQIPVAAGAALLGAAGLGQKSLELSERTGAMLRLMLFAAATNVSLNLILVPWFGYLAAGYTTLVGYAIYCYLIWRRSLTCLPWTITLSAACWALVACVAACVLGYVAMMPLQGDWERCAAGAVVFLLTYSVLTPRVRTILFSKLVPHSVERRQE